MSHTAPSPQSPQLPEDALSPELLELLTQAREYLGYGKSANTQKAYQTDWDSFTHWCKVHQLPALPASPTTIILYLTAQVNDGHKINTLTRRIAAISQAHKSMGHPTPTNDSAVRAVMAGIRRTHGIAPQRVTALLTGDIQRMVNSLPETLIGKRDRALILLGFAGAFRRSELAALNVEDIEEHTEGLSILLKRSKTDQEGQGRWVGIPYGKHPETCPVQALRDWLRASGIVTGAVFRGLKCGGKQASARISIRAIATIIKRTAKAAGLEDGRYSGHSLRAGHATAAARAGVAERVIMAQTGHKSEGMVRRYIRAGAMFQENSASSLGL
ncbi:MAG TPA: site-specific integrase [Armatimonadota bacterium]|nr:site-specific integrase [Armatimonadota bacterium]